MTGTGSGPPNTSRKRVQTATSKIGCVITKCAPASSLFWSRWASSSRSDRVGSTAQAIVKLAARPSAAPAESTPWFIWLSTLIKPTESMS